MGSLVVPPAGLAGDAKLLGVARGRRVYALIEVDGTPRIVAVGDYIDHHRIAAIGMRDVRFSDGSRLHLESAL